MSRWLRLYDDTINDPKVLKLPEAMRWHWIAMLCVASKNEGALPPLDDIAIQLRVTAAKATEILATLVKAQLLDKTETGFAPHNWSGRQYKSDVSNERVKRFRKRKCNVTEAVTVTPPETETETEADKPEANASGAAAPVDHRKRLFNEGLSKLATMTGKGPDACRSFVGKCLKAAADDAVTVLGLIEDAERNQVADPSAWIAARLKPPEFANGNGISNHRTDPAAGRATAREAHHVATMGSAALRYLQEGKSTGAGRDSAGSGPTEGTGSRNGTENAH